MQSFYDYFIKATKQHKYRIRTVLTIEELHLSKIERILQKYDLVSIDGPKKTIMQTRPLDFVTMPAAEIYIIDVVTHIPASPYILQQEIKHALNVPDSFIVVRSENDPNEIQLDDATEELEIENIAAKKGLHPAALLSTDSLYSEYETPDTGPITGDVYTKKFLQYLAKVKAERITINPVVEPKKQRMFDYLRDLPIDPEYYKPSAYVKPVAVKPGATVDAPAPVSTYGNFDDSIKTVSRAFADKNGEKVLITAKKIK